MIESDQLPAMDSEVLAAIRLSFQVPMSTNIWEFPTKRYPRIQQNVLRYPKISTNTKTVWRYFVGMKLEGILLDTT